MINVFVPRSFALLTSSSEESFISARPIFVVLNQDNQTEEKRTRETGGKGDSWEVFADVTQCCPTQT